MENSLSFYHEQSFITLFAKVSMFAINNCSIGNIPVRMIVSGFISKMNILLNAQLQAFERLQYQSMESCDDPVSELYLKITELRDRDRSNDAVSMNFPTRRFV